MERNSVLGELLYIGLLFEKGRCKGRGIWKHSYTKSLKKHVELLKKIAEQMQGQFQIEEDNIYLINVCNEIQNDRELKRYYPFDKVPTIGKKESKITGCEDENRHIEIISLIINLLDDILLELDKGLRKDKEKICKMIFSLHNLPRVYLNKKEQTLCSLGQDSITSDEALEYSKLSMDEDMLSNYGQFFTHNFGK